MARTNVSFALTAGIVKVCDDVGVVVIVVVLVVPSTNWLLVPVTFNAPDKFSLAKLGVEDVPMDCGRVNVIAPVAAVVPPLTKTWLAVPAVERTPEFAIVIDPEALVMPIPVPAVSVAKL